MINLKTILSGLIMLLIISGCATEMSSDRAVDDIAWDVVDRLSSLEERTLAVYYFTENGSDSELSEYLINSLTSRIASAFNEEKLSHKVVSRQSLDRIMKEYEFQMSSLIDENTQSEIGRQLGADLILTGTLSLEEDIYILNAQLIDVESGVVLDGFIYRMWWDG